MLNNPYVVTLAIALMGAAAGLLVLWTIHKGLKPQPRPVPPPAPTWPYVFEPAVYPAQVTDLEAARKRNTTRIAPIKGWSLQK